MSKPLISDDGVNRRGFLHCMRWAGAGLLWTVSGGVPVSRLLGAKKEQVAASSFSFIQISDSHIGFNKDANPDVVATMQEAIAKINGATETPEFLIHTGDITHFAKPEEFDAASGILMDAKTKDVFYVPGEHDVLADNGKQYMERYANGREKGWYSFDHKGVHFIGLVNVLAMKEGWGTLGDDQLTWLERDLAGKSSSTPIIVFAHIPLWAIYPRWGWTTGDSERALTALKRFGSVTVLNGHIHQTMQKVEGNITFHTATSTAFPQAKPGEGPGPGPMKVPAEDLRSLLGLTTVNYVQGHHSLAIVDSPLGA
jgi:3',5'-cyclic AMP phosphodiesterase CpdA